MASVRLVLDVLIRAGCAIAVVHFIWNMVASFRRRYVFIYGKAATRSNEPFGYWFAIACWIGASCLLALVIYHGL